MAPNPKDILSGVVERGKQAAQIGQAVAGQTIGRLRGGEEAPPADQSATVREPEPASTPPASGGRTGTRRRPPPTNPKTFTETSAADAAATEKPKRATGRAAGTK